MFCKTQTNTTRRLKDALCRDSSDQGQSTNKGGKIAKAVASLLSLHPHLDNRPFAGDGLVVVPTCHVGAWVECPHASTSLHSMHPLPNKCKQCKQHNSKISNFQKQKTIQFFPKIGN